MKRAPWECVEAALIQRTAKLFSELHLGLLASGTTRAAGDANTFVEKRGVRMTFKRVIIGSTIQLEFDCLDPEEAHAVESWKQKVRLATNLEIAPTQTPTSAQNGDKSSKKSKTPDSGASSSQSAIRLDIPYHVTLAYRINTSRVDPDENEKLRDALNLLFQIPANKESQSAENPIIPLILNPPVFSSYPDMTTFPSNCVLYEINRPLEYILKTHYANQHLIVSPRKAIENQQNGVLSSASIEGEEKNSKSNLSEPNCAVVVLGRALEDGKVTETLKMRLEHGMKMFLELRGRKGKKEEQKNGLQETVEHRPVLILSGGYTSREKPFTSEAKAMKEWLEERFSEEKRKSENLDPEEIELRRYALDHIVLEEDSLTTVENALFVRRMLLGAEFSKISKVVLVTTRSHGPRSLYLFETILLNQSEDKESINKGAKGDGENSRPDESIGRNCSSVPLKRAIVVELNTCEDADPSDSKIEGWKKGKEWFGLLVSSLISSPVFVNTSCPINASNYKELDIDSVKPAKTSSKEKEVVPELGHHVLYLYSLEHLCLRNRVFELEHCLQSLTASTEQEISKKLLTQRFFGYQVLGRPLGAVSGLKKHDLCFLPNAAALVHLAVAKGRFEILNLLLKFCPSLAFSIDQSQSTHTTPLDAAMCGYISFNGDRLFDATTISVLLSSLTSFISLKEDSKDVRVPIDDITARLEEVGLNWENRRKRAAPGERADVSTCHATLDIKESSKYLFTPAELQNSQWVSAIIYELFFVPSIMVQLQCQRKLVSDSSSKKNKSKDKTKIDKEEEENRIETLWRYYRYLSDDEMRHRSAHSMLFMIHLDTSAKNANQQIRSLKRAFRLSQQYLPSEYILQKHYRQVEIFVEGEAAHEDSTGARTRAKILNFVHSIARRARLSHGPIRDDDEIPPHYFDNIKEMTPSLQKALKGDFPQASPRSTHTVFMPAVIFVILTSDPASTSPEVAELNQLFSKKIKISNLYSYTA